MDLPTISIIVPNLNSGATLARALQSLIDQGYPSLEILVVDGGSTDESVDVIKRFETHVAWWVSEQDNGQTHAINKGLARAGGEVVNWLCSDDLLLPGALQAVGRFFAGHPGVDVLAGAGEIVFDGYPERDYTCRPERKHLALLPAYDGIMQQSCFWRRRLHRRRPVLDESYPYAMDMELWCYFKSLGATWAFIPDVLSRYHMTGTNKQSVAGVETAADMERLYRRYAHDRVPLTFWYRSLRYPFERLLRRDRGWLRRGLLGIVQVAWMLVFMPFYGYRRVRYMSWSE